MSDFVVTMLVVLNAVEYIYTFVKIAGRYHHINSSIVNKIDKYYEVIEIVADVADTGGGMVSKKKKSRNSMGLVKFCLKSVRDYTVWRLERVEAKRERHVVILMEARKKREKIADEAKERELFEIGYLRDKTSHHYIPPDLLLADISEAVVAKMNTPALASKRDLVKALIMNTAGHKLSEKDFEAYEELFYFVEVKDRLTKFHFDSVLIDGAVYSPENILWLQEKVKGLVRHNKELIAHDNRVVE
tara:strand:- start:409 stop:1143 length:735 start_codon:yes stop_codon:yes gene_type:complete